VETIYGSEPVIEALRAGRRKIERILLASGASPTRMRRLTEAAASAGVPCEPRERRELDALTRGANHQGVVAVLGSQGHQPTYSQADDILDSPGTPPLLVLLDGIEDPHNLGAILRTCEGAGVGGVFIPEHRAAGVTPAVARTSAGAVEHLRIARVTNLVPLIKELQERGFQVIAIEGGGSTIYSELDLSGPVALVFGSEGRGVRRLVRERCDQVVSIPMRGRINSLNVSVAAGVVLYEAVRQRHPITVVDKIKRSPSH